MATAKQDRRYGDWTLYKRLMEEARPYWKYLLALFGLSLLAAPLALLMPVPVSLVVDSVLSDKPLPGWFQAVVPSGWYATGDGLLLTCTLTIVGIAFLSQLQDLGMWLLKTWTGQHLILRFRARMFGHLQRLSLGYHHREGTADSIYRLQFDASSIQSVAIEGVIPFATAIVKVLVLLIAVWQLDWLLALIALAGGPVLFGLTELFRKRLRRRWRAVRERESAAMEVVQESLGAVRVVKAFGQEARESNRYRSEAESGVHAAIKAVVAHGTFDVLAGLVVGLGGAAILYIGASHVLDGQLTVGQLLLVLAYLSQLFQPLREVGTRIASMQGSLASAERVFHVLDEGREAPERTDARALDRASGAFHFENLTFGYDPDEPIIRDVDIVIPAGAKVGIAGKTGSGKSTLLSLLPRFYDPQIGAVKIDGIDVRDLKLVDLRRQYGIVLQEAVLFSTSIRENIAYGRPDASEAEIVQAAKDAAAHEFITALPEGYETNAGDRGMRLSGGERQRISLARAFLRDAPVLILDEPTSALDSETETQVIKALERLMAGRTTFMIAHRLTTLAGCDIRLQVADGRVIQRTDDDLDKVEFA